MRSPRLAFSLCAGLLLTVIPGERGHAQGGPGARAAPLAKGAGTLEAPSRLRAPHEIQGQGQKLPFTSPSSRGPDDRPAFVPFPQRSSFALVSFAPNPLVSSPYKATAEYDFLYTPALISTSPPPLKSYRYRADNGYLLRPSPAYQVAAWSYQWTRSPANQTAIRAVQGYPRVNAPAASRNPGQKIDNGLGSRAMLPRDERGLWQPSAAIHDLQLRSLVRNN